jgi:hypothetical protein
MKQALTPAAINPTPVAALAVPGATTPAEPLETKIRELAYSLYQQRGRVDGQDVQDWLDAEAIIRVKNNLAA